MLVLGFHRVEPPTGLEITRIGPDRFARLLAMAEAHGMKGAGSGPLELAANALIVTFDDGFHSIAQTALPILADRGQSTIVFLIAGSVGKTDDWDVSLLGPKRRLMGWDEINAWAGRGIEFGSHSVTHADLTALNQQALESELRDSKTMIEDKLGRPVRFLAYPYGRHTARVRAAAAEAGYDAAFATATGIAGDLFAVPRAMIHGLTTLAEFRAILRKAGHEEESTTSRRGSWRSRFFQSLNAGSATVSNWRRSAPRQRHN